MEDQLKAIAIIIAILILSSYPYIYGTLSKIKKRLGLSKKTVNKSIELFPYRRREDAIKQNIRREIKIAENVHRKSPAESSNRLFSEEVLNRAIVNSEYFISIDLLDRPTYCFGRKIGDKMEILLTKTITDQKAFELEVDNLVKYFDALMLVTTK